MPTTPEPVKPIALAEIRQARERIAKTILRTPLVRLELGPDKPDIRLKLENLQPINAYKLRGAANAVAYGTRMSFAPSAFMRSIFAAGAVSIATTVHGTPAARAAYATPWPAFPALIVQTPHLRSASGNIATALAAPRNL